jgi:phosphoribosylformylglycinamidine (FGAM) synthase-like enzyme
MVGILPDPERATTIAFKNEGDTVALVGYSLDDASLDATELSKLRGEALPDGLPPIDIPSVVRTLDVIRAASRAGTLSSIHDISEGGLLIAIAESALSGSLGASLDLGDVDDVWSTLFGERSGGFLVSGPRAAIDTLATSGVPVTPLGTIGGTDLTVSLSSITESWPLASLREATSALAPLFP